MWTKNPEQFQLVNGLLPDVALEAMGMPQATANPSLSYQIRTPEPQLSADEAAATKMAKEVEYFHSLLFVRF